MPTRRENGQTRSVGIGEGSDKHNEIMAQISNDEKLKNLIQDGKPAPAPFNGVIYNQEAQLDTVGGNLSPTSSMTASLKGGDSAVPPERSTSDQSSVMESGFHAVGRTGSVALNELDECKTDEEEVPSHENAKDKSLAVDGTGMASAVVLQAINEESDNLTRSKSEGRSGKRNWLSGFFGSFRRGGRGKERPIKEEGTQDLESHPLGSHQQGGDDHPPSGGPHDDDDGDAMMTARSAPPPAETSEKHDEEVPIQEQAEQELTEQTEATVMENSEEEEQVEEQVNKGLQLEQSITIEPVDTDEHEQEQHTEKFEAEDKIPAPPPLPPKPIDRSDPGDVSSIASRFNIPEKPLIPKVKKTASYLKDDDVGITLGMRRAPSHNKKKQTDEQQPTTSAPKSIGSATHSQEKHEDDNEAVSSQTSEENRVQKLMKGWHQGAPIKAQALGEEDQEPEIEELSLEKSTSSTIKSPPPKNQNISSIRESFKEQEQRFMEKRASKLGSVEKAGVKSAVMKFDVPPPKPPKKEPNKDTSFGQNLLKFQEESKPTK